MQCNLWKAIFFSFIIASFDGLAQADVRYEVSLNEGWTTIAHDSLVDAYDGFEKENYEDAEWKKVNVPHNWDGYEGYRRLRHGNRHGYAWYRKTFTVSIVSPRKRYFLWFEGVGSYATVWLNEKKVGYHAGGRTSFTIDVTDAILLNKRNVLAVRADHPASIRDLPWVCGGCSEEVGFSEGSQPMGIFRPVHLIATSDVRVEPFGFHVWNDTTVTSHRAVLHLATEIKNYSLKPRTVTVRNKLLDNKGNQVAVITQQKKIAPGNITSIEQVMPELRDPHLWSLKDPYLYTIVTEVLEKGKIIDRTTTPYGIRWVKWDIEAGGTNRFFLNGKPVFINGTAEYEHMMGQSHAFSDEQIRARVMQIKATGFNAFRDAHQPHNLRYHQHWDALGVLWWTQQSAHIWFDTPEFKTNFKALLADWVKERRNSPSLVMWGIQNESKLPEDFARECMEIIRKLDPTASTQRKVTTCNGGKGTDWDVPQNWTGTYGGNPDLYHEDIQRQVLVGEYGAWRSLGLHSEDITSNVHSEEKMTHLMEKKIRLAESVKDKCSGHFHWLFTSHENPGRVQGGEGWRELDRVGPVNYKGLLTAWGEPTDAFYMFRANYAQKEKEPMVYIVSPTWPDRWTTSGIKKNIVVYSNCDEVELFNDVRERSLGKKSHRGIGTHFQWDSVDIRYNVLYAVGYINGKEVAQDHIVLHHLPNAPHHEVLIEKKNTLLQPQSDLNYAYRVNCGGPDYIDMHGNRWMADVHKTMDTTWGSTSWTDHFNDMSPYYGSQRKTNDLVRGTADYKLFQYYRYGRDKLHYEFPVPNGEYVVELYFSEPWYGKGGSMDCTGWRLFDVAVNDEIIIQDLDIWRAVGYNTAFKQTFKVQSKNGRIVISFPRVAAAQAVIAAIAIATRAQHITPAPASASLMKDFRLNVQMASNQWSVRSWLDTGDKPYANSDIQYSALPPVLYGAEWIQTARYSGVQLTQLAEFTVKQNCDVFVGIDPSMPIPTWLADFEDTKMFIETNEGGGLSYKVLRKRFTKNTIVTLGHIGNDDRYRMYTVAVVRATDMQPAIDLRPVTNYEADKAKFQAPAVTKNFILNRNSLVFKQKHGSIQWNISLGVAGLYALRFRYYHTSSEIASADMKVIAADGTVMHEERLHFHPVNESKWKLAHASTGTMINAGDYTIQLTAVDANELNIRDLEVQ